LRRQIGPAGPRLEDGELVGSAQVLPHRRRPAGEQPAEPLAQRRGGPVPGPRPRHPPGIEALVGVVERQPHVLGKGDRPVALDAVGDRSHRGRGWGDEPWAARAAASWPSYHCCLAGYVLTLRSDASATRITSLSALRVW